MNTTRVGAKTGLICGVVVLSSWLNPGPSLAAETQAGAPTAGGGAAAPAAGPGALQAPANAPGGPAPVVAGEDPQAQPGSNPPGSAAGEGAAQPELEPQPVELWLGLGLGNAVCDNEKPDSDCPVETGSAFLLGGAWRLHQRWALGAELAGWNFGVRDEWKGQLEDSATDVKFGSSYLALIARWYWLASVGHHHGYLQFGLGFGSVQAEATGSAGAKYRVQTKGAVFPLGIGFDFELADIFRLGPQALAYLQTSSERCEEINGQGETCVDSGKDDNALPYRLVLMATFNFGR